MEAGSKICPIAIPSQISTISMYIPNLVKTHWHLLVIIRKQKYGWTEGHTSRNIRWMDGGATHGWPMWYHNTLPLLYVWRGIKNRKLFQNVFCWNFYQSCKKSLRQHTVLRTPGARILCTKCLPENWFQMQDLLSSFKFYLLWSTTTTKGG